MPASNVETLTNPRDSLPNVYNNVTAREQDFVSVFNLNWDALRSILGIVRPIQKAPGSALVSYSASVALESGDVGPGEVIPYSKRTITKSAMKDLSVEKFASAVPVEDVVKYGAAVAIEKGDEAFRNELQNKVLTEFYTFLNTGSLTGAETDWQMALAMAKGKVLDKFNKMRKTVTSVVGFANVLDAYGYLGAAGINNVETQFGISYLRNFLGYSTLILLSEPDIPRGRVIAIPTNNIDMYYVNPSDDELARLDLHYTVDGETPLIGFAVKGDYNTAVGATFALMGMTLWAEYLDGIAVIDVGTESFSAVSNPAGNPAALSYYEKDASNNYFRTTDETVVSGKTYYSRTVTAAA